MLHTAARRMNVRARAFAVRTLVARTLGVGLATGVLAFGGVVFAPRPACACSCVAFTPAQAWARADAVFVGRVGDRASKDLFPWQHTGVDVWTVEVDKIYKGEVQRRQEIVTMDSGAACGLELEGSGPFVIYATHDDPSLDPERDQYATGLCDGSQPLTPEVEHSLDQQAPGGQVPPGGSAASSAEHGGGGLSAPLVVGLGVIGAASRQFSAG